jgi:hypothetical protein
VPPFNVTSRPVCLSHVCKYRREISISAHQLWTRYPVDLPIAEEFLRRSGNLPLTLAVSNLNSLVYDHDPSPPIQDILSPALQRCHRLDIRLTGRLGLQLLSKLLSQSHSMTDISFYNVSVISHNLQQALSPVSAQLQSLELHYFFPFDFSNFRSLTRLVLQPHQDSNIRISGPDFLVSLGMLPLLEELWCIDLKIVCPGEWWAIKPSLRSLHGLSSLRRISISNTPSDNLSFMMGSLTLPTLLEFHTRIALNRLHGPRDFVIFNIDDISGIIPPLSDKCSRSSSSRGGF